MTSSSRGSGDASAAQHLVEAITRRAALHEAIGVVQAWSGDQDDVLGRFCDRRTEAEREAEVERVNAVVDAAAERRTDPDWDD
ncbi:hypothetical protein [Lentzea flaviverrucosa]|uniref:Uncharacterized protein n=1 Tax=Lentzea flaviverrucosa TaxID=200379 RepID=A0A1H9GTM5_9PSEU|nr:hypothetical protein [Lentzea flaviverrucosa]RDI34801.1 hypothetical protein DFR72_101550 [Lentzea flaviverrucosa]SEQ53476.1 hypothetical protein SAMN05216195_102667 [Lentzea flaviverrucosa]